MLRLWLSVAHEDMLLREAARTAPYETGGVLLGYRGEGGDVVVTDVVGPGPNASHARASFVPDHGYHDGEIARLYAESGRRHAYLGDWHSHPGGSCALSRTDRRTLRRIATTAEARAPEPLMLIVGGFVDWTFAAHHLALGAAWFRPVRSLEIVRFG